MVVLNHQRTDLEARIMINVFLDVRTVFLASFFCFFQRIDFGIDNEQTSAAATASDISWHRLFSYTDEGFRNFGLFLTECAKFRIF
jgi:hypothetical protein